MSRQPELIRRNLRLFLCYNVDNSSVGTLDTLTTEIGDRRGRTVCMGSLPGNVTVRVLSTKRFVFRRTIFGTRVHARVSW